MYTAPRREHYLWGFTTSGKLCFIILFFPFVASLFTFWYRRYLHLRMLFASFSFICRIRFRSFSAGAIFGECTPHKGGSSTLGALPHLGHRCLFSCFVSFCHSCSMQVNTIWVAFQMLWMLWDIWMAKMYSARHFDWMNGWIHAE